MAQEQRKFSFGEPGHNGNPPADAIDEFSLPEEASFLIHLAFEELEEVLMDYPHHGTYCFAAITRLVHTEVELSTLARRIGMWLWMEVLAFQTEEPLSISELAEHFSISPGDFEDALDELLDAEEFELEWKEKDEVKLVPRLLAETIIHFAEQVLGGIEEAERDLQDEQAEDS